MRRRNKSAGFTLVELLVTVAIIGVLAAIATPMYIKYTYKARTVEARTNLGGIRTGQISFKTGSDRYVAVRVEPAFEGGAPTGTKKPWPGFPPNNLATQTGNGTFQNIGFEPAGQVYYHYACSTLGEAIRCEATSDLDYDGSPSVFSVSWRLQDSDRPPGGPFTGGVPVTEWGPVVALTPGRF